MKTLYKIIDLVLKYSIGKRLVIVEGKTARSIQTGQYIKYTPVVKKRSIVVHDYLDGDYIINL